jgi:hypothetical protein
VRARYDPDGSSFLDDVSPRIEPRHEFVGTYIVPSVTVSVECWVLSWRRRKGNQWFHKSG